MLHLFTQPQGIDINQRNGLIIALPFLFSQHSSKSTSQGLVFISYIHYPFLRKNFTLCYDAIIMFSKMYALN